jgi:hypothetical protein
LTQIPNLLVIGKVIENDKPGTFTPRSQRVLASPLATVSFLVPTVYISIFLRNGKIHATEGSPSLFTSSEEIQTLRKLLCGLDEYRVRSREMLYRVRTARWWWYSEQVRETALQTLENAWATYTGLVRILRVSLQ